jgi:hypothetical protein
VLAAGAAVPHPATASMTSPAKMFLFMAPPGFDPESKTAAQVAAGASAEVPSPFAAGRGPAASRSATAVLPAIAGGLTLADRDRAWGQRDSLGTGVRSMTMAAIAQAAHPAMESSAPMFGYHDTCVGPKSVCTVMLATPKRVKTQ